MHATDCFQQPASTAAFLAQMLDAPVSGLHWLASGSHTRVFGFDWQQRTWVLRVARSPEQILKCWQAERWLRHWLPLPHTLQQGQQDGFYWSIQSRLPGQPLSSLPPAQQGQLLPQILQRWADFQAAAPLLQPACGYGPLHWEQGTGFASWQAFLADSVILRADPTRWKHPAHRQAFERAQARYQKLCPHCPETAFVLHGDAKGANLLVDGQALRGVVDWATLGCGDWAYDPAALVLYLPLPLWSEAIGLTQQAYDRFDQQDLMARLLCYMLHSALEALIHLAPHEMPDSTADRRTADMLQRLAALDQLATDSGL
ncbi:MAG: aminoglycoside phosphotransferase family protein [Candidatus Sericytochromatia bacterium]|nr:aminoglycoside phosphotransferase family protein [Candidatus Sericytochromatia bacterium]